jgi:hypothetical protein
MSKSNKAVKIAFEEVSLDSGDVSKMSSKSKKGTGQDGEVILEAEAFAVGEGGAHPKESSQSGRGSVLFDEDNEFHKKWAAPVILGPFLPCVVAVIIIVSGQIIINTWRGTCGYAIDSKYSIFHGRQCLIYLVIHFAAFIAAAVAVCYLYLMLFAWVFIGDTFRLKISVLDLNIKILQPFTSLQWLMLFYGILFFVGFIVWIVGTVLLSKAYLCVYTAPSLYSYATFLVAIYWLGFCIGVLYIIKLFYGDFITNIIKENVRAPTANELEDRIFRKSYAEFDKEREGHISRDDVGNLLQVLGVYIPENELPALLSSFDPTETGIVRFDVLYDWFKQLNSMADNAGPNDD